MEPRADFSCRSCAKAAGEEGLHVHADLPVGSKRCPISGAKINRLFNAVNVATSSVRAADKFVEPMLERAAQAPVKGTGTHGGTTLPFSGAQGAAVMGRDQTGAAGFSRGAIVPLIKTLKGPRPGAYRE